MNHINVGFDIHGVLDTNPEFFLTIIRALRLMRNNYGVSVTIHIITGSRDTPEIIQQLKDINESIYVWWDQFFSIQDHLEKYYLEQSIGENKEGQLIFPDDLWNKAKAKYCEEKSIDIHFDDSNDYLNNFTTNCFLYKHKKVI